MENVKGSVYLISTPIGNLKDITLRAIEILNEVEVIFCEDTRTSKVLLKEHNINNKLESLHKFNELSRFEYICELLNNNKSIAIISDAGTPLISDPGQLIISKLKANYKIIPVPGASAILSALVGSGLIFDSFVFLGFIPKQINQIETLITNNLTIDLLIFYESPKRIHQTLLTLKSLFGNIKVTIARELTKFYEEILTLDLESWSQKEIRGEIVLILNIKEIAFDIEEKIILAKAKKLLSFNVDKKEIAKFLETNSCSKNKIYKMLH